jgi:hypothetical protein
VNIKISKNLLPNGSETKEERRKKRGTLRGVLRIRGCDLLEEHGYTFGASLRIPGSTTFSAARDGQPVKVAIKSSADRWVGVSLPAMQWGVLTQVEEVLVVTFANPRKRDRLQVYRFQPAVLIKAGKKVFDESGKEDGTQWLPLDDTADMHVHSMAGGSLAKQGELIAEAKVEWIDDDAVSDELPEDEGSLSDDTAMKVLSNLTISQAKIGLGAHFGVPPENVKITIEG